MVTTYLPKVWFHVFFFFFLPKQNSRSKAFAKEDNRSGMPKVTPPRYLSYQFFLPSFLPSLPPTHTHTYPPGAGHDLASTLLHIKLFLGYIE